MPPARQGMAAEEVAEFCAAHYAKAELSCSHADQVRVCTQLVLSDLLPPQPARHGVRMRSAITPSTFRAAEWSGQWADSTAQGSEGGCGRAA